jgi:hypothetical protein
MTKLYLAVCIAAFLTGCGGDGGFPVSSSTPQNLATAPTPSASAPSMTTTAYKLGGSGQESVVKFSGAADLAVGGEFNKIWLSATLVGGSVIVNGNQNTLVFLRDVHTAIIVTGTSNTFYFPLGSSLKLEGAGAASSTIRYFIP